MLPTDKYQQHINKYIQITNSSIYQQMSTNIKKYNQIATYNKYQHVLTTIATRLSNSNKLNKYITYISKYQQTK